MLLLTLYHTCCKNNRLSFAGLVISLFAFSCATPAWRCSLFRTPAHTASCAHRSVRVMLYYAVQHPSVAADDLAVLALNLLMLALAACESSTNEQVCALSKG